MRESGRPEKVVAIMVHQGSDRVFPVLLSGGAGSRLWPLSREQTPKPLIHLIGHQTLLQKTVLRSMDETLFSRPTIISGAEHRFLVAEQLREIGATGTRIVLEPVPRNTAPAAAIAALLVDRLTQDGLVLLMPADHLIEDYSAFREAVLAAIPIAKSGYLTLFGIQPDSPATGYGYIHAASGSMTAKDHQRPRFVEKPDRKSAEWYVESGDYLWNSGIVLAQATTLIQELLAFEPDLIHAARAALDRASEDPDFLRLDEASFARCRSVSLDYAVLERSAWVAVVLAAFGWRDIGSWSALWDATEPDDAGNVVVGDVITESTSNSYVRSEGPLIATVGVENLVIVAGEDAILVARKDRDQDVRKIVEALRKRGDPRV